jgi:tetratricopeptide (TPR) repeat protein
MRARLGLIAALFLAGCPHEQVMPTAGDGEAERVRTPREKAQVQFDLGANDQGSGNVRQALGEYQAALGFDPEFAEAENALGVLYHLSFRQLDEAEKHYQRAIKLKGDYSAAKNNLAALYIDLGRYDECLKLEEEALKDLQYKNSFMAANNEGWCYHLKGDDAHAVPLISETVRANPDFCQGYRNLGVIYAKQGKLDLAGVELDKMIKKCPDSAQGYYELGKLRVQQNQPDDARKFFGLCRDKSREGDPLLDECARLAAGGKP